MRFAFFPALVVLAACSSDPENPAPSPDPQPSQTTDGTNVAQPPSSTVGTPPPPPAKPVDDPGPPPVGCSDITPDGDGFFWRNSGKSNYTGIVPKGYSGKPTRMVVGLHGCGDEAYNFGTWAVSPYDTRQTQDWIGVSVESPRGGGGCWKQSDEDAVFAAIADISKCFYVHQQKVVLAGFSSGGELAYGMGMRHADKFAGLLVECTTLSSAGDPDTLIAGAAWKINIAHFAHDQDSVFPITKVKSDWSKLTAAGFPLQTHEEDGDHNGTSDDWVNWLDPKMADWKAP